MEAINTTPSLYERLFKKEWSYLTGAVLITSLAMTLNAFSGIWGVSGPLASWGGKVLTFIGVDADSWKMYNGSLAKFTFFGSKPSITDVGLIFGALISCLLAAQWKIRKIKHWKQIAAAIIGGILMGVGAKLASGCNIGGLFSQLPAFSGAGWVFLIFVFLGATVGGKLLKFFMPPASNKRPDRKRLSADEVRRNKIIQIIIGFVLLVFLVVVSVIVAPKYPLAPAFIFIGVGLGYSMQRSRFCFTAAYRDPTLTGETKVTKAVIVAFALSTIAFFGFHIKTYGIDMANLEKLPGNPIHLQMMIGAFVFGIGAVLAGGCASGTFIRVGEGYVQNLIALPFFVIGSMIGTPLVASLKGSAIQTGKVVYLPQLFGGFVPALVIQLLVLLLLWILADRWEATRKHL